MNGTYVLKNVFIYIKLFIKDKTFLLLLLQKLATLKVRKHEIKQRFLFLFICRRFCESQLYKFKSELVRIRVVLIALW